MNDQVSIAKLLFVGGLVETVAKGHAAIAHGKVYVEEWNIGVAETTLPRWVLRGVTIRIGDKSMTIAPDAHSILRSQRATLL